MISDEIRAKVDEAERRLDRRTGADDPGAITVEDGHDQWERAQIEHARDVLGRHKEFEDRCVQCWNAMDGAWPWPCPEILSLAKAWGVEP